MALSIELLTGDDKISVRINDLKFAVIIDRA